MERLEQGAVEKAPEPENPKLPISDNRVQVALIKWWGEHKNDQTFADNNAMMMAFITDGWAEKFRFHADQNPNETVDINDSDQLKDLFESLPTNKTH